MATVPPSHLDIDAIRASEEQLRAFMQHTPLIAFMKDRDGRYVYANAQLEQVFGVSAAEICNKADTDWLPERTARTVRQHDRSVLSTGQTLEVIETITAAGGGERHWLVKKFLFTDSLGQRFVGGVGMDVTSLKEIETRLTHSEERYRQLVENSQGLICTHDLAGQILSTNPAAQRSLGYTAEELAGRNLAELLHPRARDQFPSYLERIAHAGEDAGLMVVTTKAGTVRTWQYHNVHLPADNYVLGHAQDVTELREAQAQLEIVAVTDELTGLLNRRGFFKRASRLLSHASSAASVFTVFYADVDGLKDINDSLGHDAGSAIIVAAARALENTFRAADILARVGGDEFVALAELPADATPLVRQRLNEHLHSVNARRHLPAPLSLSMGAVQTQAGNPATMEDLIRRADLDMYAEKIQKRSQGPVT